MGSVRVLRLISSIVRRGAAAFAAGALLLGPTTVAAAANGAVDFQRQVRPVLSDACFQCHGPDPATRIAGLRLDVRDGAFEERANGTPIVAGAPEKSLLYQRITHQDPAQRMPPEYSHKEVSAEQTELIRQWIEQGAVWEEHWAFTPPVRSEPPAVRPAEWPRNPIDRFLLARLDAAGLEPAPEAGRRPLIRRASLDITGLPPSLEQVEAFVNDPSPDAYERLVNRLLNSEAYGEHRARYWLDAARYADTHGLHIDNYREMWPYRDWVIGAFNRNLPFDQFTVEQIAGDLLPNPTTEQLVATGFHRCNITTNEGGVIDDEVAVMYAKDRVDTTGTVWLGLTVGCATCHDHKFDPITQRDFYSLAAFFRNTTQKPRDGNYFDTPPVIILPARADRPRWEELREEEPAARSRLGEIRLGAKDGFEAWLRSRKQRSIDVGRFDASEVLSLDLGRRPKVRLGARHRSLNLSKGASIQKGPGLPSLDLPDEAFAEIPKFPSLSADEPFTVSIVFSLKEGAKSRVLLSQADPDDDSRGWRLEVAKGLPSVLLTVRDGRAIGVKAIGERKVKTGEWHRVTVTYDGFRKRSGFSLYLDGELLPTESIGRAVALLRGSIETSEPLLLGAQDTEDGEKAGFLQGAIADLRILNRAVTEPEARLLASWDSLSTARRKRRGALAPAEREALEHYYLVRDNRDYRSAMNDLQALEDERRAILRRSSVTHVMQEKEDSEPVAHILYRGMYDQPREEVGPATPGVLPPMPASFPRNRLGLAKWLVDDSHPLTSRVTVNRFWQEVFGKGLVTTAEDFGSQGEAPSHPKLLDWLAVEFRESGWDVKHLFHLMLTSAAYRQSAATSEAKLNKDAGNRLLSRGPRARMDGEMVRDYALAASGLLASRIGGPSVRPYQPEDVWETVAMKGSNTRFYEQDTGENLYRRSLYTFWKRAAPPPSMTVFNAPTREFCSVRRERTNTPLQALLTLNGPDYFEAARHLAQRASHAEENLQGRLDFMSARLLARPLAQTERDVVGRAYQDYLQFYNSHPDKAREALSVGDSEPDARLPAPEFAALTMVANQLMNLDEVLNK